VRRTRAIVGALVLSIATGGCATSTADSAQLLATLERLEAAAVKSEMAAEQAAVAADRAAGSDGAGEPPAPSGPYHSALRHWEFRNATPRPVQTDREASDAATQFLAVQRVDWGTPSSVSRTPTGWYLVEFPYQQTDRWDLDGVLLVDPASGDVFLPLPR